MKKLIGLVFAGVSIFFLVSCGSSGPSGPDASTPTDSTLLGGIRKLVAGMWWTESENDTTVSVKDSASVTIITRDTVIHHKRTTVNSVSVVNGNLYYQLVTSDTVLPQTGNPTVTSLTLMHNATQVQYVLPPNGYFNDSIRVKAYDLPLTVGKSWEAFNVTGDTTMRILFGIIWIKLTVDYSYNGQFGVTGTTDYHFGDTTRSCFVLSNTTNTNAAIISDTNIVLQLGTIVDTLIHLNDTILTSRTVETSSSYVNAQLSIPLWSYGVQAKCDSNYINSVVEHDTTRKGTRITSYTSILQ
jgi:hypothetical protein